MTMSVHGFYFKTALNAMQYRCKHGDRSTEKKEEDNNKKEEIMVQRFSSEKATAFQIYPTLS